MRPDWITVTEFGKRLGVSRTAVYKWLQQHPDIRPHKVAGLVLLSPKHQRQLTERRRGPGRPRHAA